MKYNLWNLILGFILGVIIIPGILLCIIALLIEGLLGPVYIRLGYLIWIIGTIAAFALLDNKGYKFILSLTLMMIFSIMLLTDSTGENNWICFFLPAINYPVLYWIGGLLNKNVTAKKEADKEYEKRQHNTSISKEIALYEKDIISLENEIKDVQSINDLAMLLIACDQEAHELIKRPEINRILAINEEISMKKNKIEDLKKDYH